MLCSVSGIFSFFSSEILIKTLINVEIVVLNLFTTLCHFQENHAKTWFIIMTILTHNINSENVSTIIIDKCKLHIHSI